MRKTLTSPAPQLSQLKTFNIDLDMTGRHYALLASCEGQVPEDVALSILKDLLEEDANKLTIAELRYLFMLVKINSMENEYPVYVICTHNKEDGTPCKHKNKYKVYLSDNDLNKTPNNYQVPAIMFRTEDTEKEYKVMPPTMDLETKLYEYFQTDKNVSYDKIGENKQDAFEYTFIRDVMHLVDKGGTRLVNLDTNLSDVNKYLDCNKYKTIGQLYELCAKVDSYGVQNKVYHIKCKECGGNLVFQLPLLNGLVD